MDEAASSTTSLSTPQTLAVYEVETRGYKNTSFHVSKQLPHFQLQSGNPSLSLEEVNCPDGYKFISNWKIDYVAPNVEGVERSTDRYFDKHGWEYSTAWEKLISPMRMPRGTLKITDKVRRRRWIRRMVKIDPMESVSRPEDRDRPERIRENQLPSAIRLPRQIRSCRCLR